MLLTVGISSTTGNTIHIVQYSLNLCFTAKFNCTVPGTLCNFIEECNVTTTAAMSTEKTTTSVVPSLHTTTSKPDNNIIDEPMMNFIYVLAGIGGVILILITLVTIVCIFLCLPLAKRKSYMLTLTAAPPHNVYTMEDDERPQFGR